MGFSSIENIKKIFTSLGLVLCNMSHIYYNSHLIHWRAFAKIFFFLEKKNPLFQLLICINWKLILTRENKIYELKEIYSRGLPHGMFIISLRYRLLNHTSRKILHFTFSLDLVTVKRWDFYDSNFAFKRKNWFLTSLSLNGQFLKIIIS